jgi:N-acyl homoserine lactone hydrolase
LVDTGPPAYIPLLHEGLGRLGLTTEDVTDILATHLHWDHIGNFTMFSNATVSVSRRELDWAREQPPGTTFIPDLHVRRLAETIKDVKLIEDGQEVLSGIYAIATPGHTPGHLCYLASTTEGKVLFAGDAVKNRYELATGNVDSSMDFPASRASVERLRLILQADSSVSMIPGHDVQLSYVDGDVHARKLQQAELSVFIDNKSGAVSRQIV